jgi:hypothetical protein
MKLLFGVGTELRCWKQDAILPARKNKNKRHIRNDVQLLFLNDRASTIL